VTITLIARFDREHAGARLLRLGGRDVVRRHESVGESLSNVGHVRLRARDTLFQDVHRRPRSDDGPEGSRHLETKIGLGHRHVRTRGSGFGTCRALERVAAAAGETPPRSCQW
jgi:hypothetical protein